MHRLRPLVSPSANAFCNRVGPRPAVASRVSGHGFRHSAVSALRAQLRKDDEPREADEAFPTVDVVDGPSMWPLFMLPVWGGLVLAGLFFPAPEMWMSMFDPVLQSVGPVSEVMAASSVTDAMAASVASFGAAAQAAQGSLQGGLSLQQLGSSNLDPSTFVPVCQFADTFYRGTQQLVLKLAGRETYQEYAPLIAGSLLRVRLEFCVLESFVYESIIPFVKARGLSWVFPVKETLETFIAGVVFAVASNLVLIGSTKIITILISYIDIFFGFPLRFVFGFINDRVRGAGLDKSVPGKGVVLVTGGIKFVGQTSGFIRQCVEAVDVFVGRYLLLTTVGYVGLKLLKFKGLLVFDPAAIIKFLSTIAEAGSQAAQ
ncbi:hypothetical protein T484DRAFT_1809517 [Baffinella frigidus]|nr:hypothetical protein T484DRAFT_1809517 [Cryptophyta sp. CCMP2293]